MLSKRICINENLILNLGFTRGSGFFYKKSIKVYLFPNFIYVFENYKPNRTCNFNIDQVREFIKYIKDYD